MVKIVGLYRSESGRRIVDVYHYADENGQPFCGASGPVVARPIDEGRPCPHCYEHAKETVCIVCDSWGNPDTEKKVHRLNDGSTSCTGNISTVVITTPSVGSKKCTFCFEHSQKPSDEFGFQTFTSAKLTKNGSSSLILTVPHMWWRDAGIDNDDPPSVAMDYDPESKTVVMDFREDRREI